MSPAQQTSFSKRLLFWLIAGVGIPLGVLAIIEGASSAALFVHDFVGSRPPENPHRLAPDTLLGWVAQANLKIPDMYGPGIRFTTNEIGARVHRPIPAELGPGEQRAICSGDSFTFGLGVSDDQTWCAGLETTLPGVRVVNLAQRGYGIDQAYLWYKRDGGRYPHQLHLFAFIFDDVERMGMDEFWGTPKPRLEVQGGHLAVKNVPVAAGSEGQVRRAYAARTVLTDLRLFQLIQRFTDHGPGPRYRAAEKGLWPVAEKVFDDLTAINRARGSQLVLVYLPTRNDLKPGPLDVRRHLLEAYGQRSGVPVIDLTPELRALPADSVDLAFITLNALPFQGASGHYTALGNRMVAQWLAKRLLALGAVKESGQPRRTSP